MNVEMIAGGIHVPPIILRLIHKFKGTSRTALITDALACAASDCETAFDPRVIVEDGVCKLFSTARPSPAVSQRWTVSSVSPSTRPRSTPRTRRPHGIGDYPPASSACVDRKGGLFEHRRRAPTSSSWTRLFTSKASSRWAATSK